MKIILPILLFLSLAFSVFSQNQCLHFDGANDYIQLEDFTLTGGFTISYWFKPDPGSNGEFDDRVVSIGPQIRLELGLGDNVSCESNTLFFYDEVLSATTPFCVPGINLSDGEWHYITFTVSSAGIRSVFIDGQFIGAESTPNFFTYGNKLRLGAWTGALSTHTFFMGMIDEVRIYKRVLGREEILETQFCELEGDEEDLWVYYNFNQGIPAGNNADVVTLIDQSGNGHDAELMGFSLEGETSNWIQSNNSPVVECITTSTKVEEIESINIFPNPTRGELSIENPLGLTGTINILDISGQLISSQALNGQNSIDLSQQAAGLYIIQVFSQQQTQVFKLSKL